MKITARATQIAEQRAVREVLEHRERTVVERHPRADLYRGLHQFSLALVPIDLPSSTGAKHLNLVLPEFTPSLFFAGVRSSVQIAVALAKELDLPLRIVALGSFISVRRRAQLHDLLRRHFGNAGSNVEIVSAARGFTFTGSDVWVATHWTTAHACSVCVDVGLLDAARVVYLIQDYEPAFYAMSTDHALAAGTYHRGFRPMVNSTPLQSYLQGAESLSIPDAFVFHPQIDVNRAEIAAAQRAHTEQNTIGFYARPGTDRNMFRLGRVALRVTAERISGMRKIRYISFGEHHEPVRLAQDLTLQNLGALDWDTYFAELASVRVLLSLQATPHPSHPPIDAVVSGGAAVTNRLGTSRDDLSPRLRAVDPSPEALADAIVELFEETRAPAAFDPGTLVKLGRPLPDVIASAAADLRR